MYLQTLITTMNQTDFSIVKNMNIQTDCIIANQASSYAYDTLDYNNHIIKLITTNTIGLSVNRNIAITQIDSKAEYILFSDDDLIFYDGYEQLIKKEFEEHKDAEAILFGLNCISNNKLSRKEAVSFTKATRTNVTASGICGLVIKKEILLKNNLHFNQLFGAGVENYCGEDSIFLQDMLKKKIRLFKSPVIIANITTEVSTWFEGYTDKFFITAGKTLAAIYPSICKLLAIRSAYKMSKKEKINRNFTDLLKLYLLGIKQYKC